MGQALGGDGEEPEPYDRLQRARHFHELVDIRLATARKIVGEACGMALMVGVTVALLFDPALLVSVGTGGTAGFAVYAVRAKSRLGQRAD